MFDFDTYHKARSIADAVHLLKENPDCRPLAGGTDILIRLRQGNKRYAHLVDIHHLDELRQIDKRKDGTITIGSGTTFNQVAQSEIIINTIPVVAEGALSVGGPQVRNIATLGGNVCNGAPSADIAGPLLVLNTTVELMGPDGLRQLPLEAFYQGPGQVDLRPAEILTGFQIAPENHDGFTGHYIKYAMRDAMDIATIGCAGSCKLMADKISHIRLAYTVAGPTPLRCPKIEKKLAGMTVGEDMMSVVKQHILDDLNPRDSWRASKAFREHIIINLTERMVRRIVGLKGA